MRFGHADDLLILFAEKSDVDEMINVFRVVWKHSSLGIWFADLLSGGHPNVGYNDFLLVEDRKKSRIASFAGLVSQIWKYGGVSFSARYTFSALQRHALAR
jgi:hypothetical protein